MVTTRPFTKSPAPNSCEAIWILWSDGKIDTREAKRRMAYAPDHVTVKHDMLECMHLAEKY